MKVNKIIEILENHYNEERNAIFSFSKYESVNFLGYFVKDTDYYSEFSKDFNIDKNNNIIGVQPYNDKNDHLEFSNYIENIIKLEKI